MPLIGSGKCRAQGEIETWGFVGLAGLEGLFDCLLADQAFNETNSILLFPSFLVVNCRSTFLYITKITDGSAFLSISLDSRKENRVRIRSSLYVFAD